jgi:hypothetical protein
MFVICVFLKKYNNVVFSVLLWSTFKLKLFLLQSGVFIPRRGQAQSSFGLRFFWFQSSARRLVRCTNRWDRRQKRRSQIHLKVTAVICPVIVECKLLSSRFFLLSKNLMYSFDFWKNVKGCNLSSAQIHL